MPPNVVVGQLMQHGAEQAVIIAEHILVAIGPETDGDLVGVASPAAIILSLLRRPNNV